MANAKSDTTSPSPFWAIVLDGAGLYIADSEADAASIQQLLEYEWGEACVVYPPSDVQPCAGDNANV